MWKNAVLVIVATFFLLSFGKLKNTEVKDEINWLSIEEVSAKNELEPRLVLIDLYTNWCYWCKVMDKRTYKDEKVIAYINNNFYAVKLNAETKETIEWSNKIYQFNPKYNVNDFSLYVTNGRLGFPTTVIFPGIKNVPAAISGFMEPKEMEPILKYFGEGAYKTKNFKEFSRTFEETW